MTVNELRALAPARVASADAERAVATLLEYVGEDPSRDGLRDTPSRVVRALRELTSGYGSDPAAILSRTFEESSDELILLRGIEFHSTCEHHLLPFHGTVTVGYLPGRVVGISKLARLVDCFARRLQIQERMTNQIAQAIETHLEARGTGVVVSARHLCMACRGVRKESTVMVTSAMLGGLRTDAASRAEFLRLAALS
jgi:GTP cyclohydrolase I